MLNVKTRYNDVRRECLIISFSRGLGENDVMALFIDTMPWDALMCFLISFLVGFM